MIQTLTKNWWLLALCGILNAIIAVIYFMMFDADGPLISPAFRDALASLNWLALAAGACTIAAGLWRSAQGWSWLLVLNGLALSAYGLIPLFFWAHPLSFLLFARLLVVMAVSIGIVELVAARTLRRERHIADEWFFGLAGAASVSFAVGFLALIFNWIQLERRAFHPSIFLWLACYFGFSAICLLLLAPRLHGLGNSLSWGNPKHAH